MSETLGRILIIDHEPDVLEMLALYFSDGRFEVMTAGDGADAITMARFHRPDVVLVDATMSDSASVLKAIRAMNAGTRVVMMTGNAYATVARDVFDHVAKPFDFDVLDGIVAAAVAAGAGRAWSSVRADRAGRTGAGRSLRSAVAAAG